MKEEVDVDVYCELHRLHPHLKTLTPEEVKELEENGIRVKKGRFSDAENKRIRKNHKRFKKKLLIEMTEDEANENIRQRLGFYRKKRNAATHTKQYVMYLGRKLEDRALSCIYDRARKLFSSLRNEKDLCFEEKQEILVLHKVHGTNYKKIGRLVDCKPSAAQQLVRRKVSRSGNLAANGVFTKEESIQLLNAIRKELEIEDIKDCLTRVIPWVAVAKSVPTRSELQCEKYFSQNLKSRIGVCRNFDPPIDTNKYLAQILYFIYKEKYTSESDIDWDMLKIKMSDCTMQEIFEFFEELKNMAPAESDSFRKMIKHLYKNKLPELVDLNIESEQLEAFYLA
ncbi:Transcription termination factor 1 [Halotydeus destructor]|nr:Transcription termination factor 1 [Halotydeus destructor]